jgi:DNA-binding transcriptional LysR family regulator
MPITGRVNQQRRMNWRHSDVICVVEAGAWEFKGIEPEGTQLCDCARVVCCSPDYATDHGLPESVAELARHACIDFAHVRTSDLWQFETEPGGDRPLSVLVRSRIIVNNFEAIGDRRIGLALLPTFLAIEPLREGRLISALPHAMPRVGTSWAVYPYTHHVSSKVRTTTPLPVMNRQ